MEESDIILLVKERIGLEKFLHKLHQKLEQGFRELAANRITVPSRQDFYFRNGAIISMPATDKLFFACKIVNTHCGNPNKYNIPTVMASGTLIDCKTGYPLMIIASTILTSLRTGAVSGIATKYLAKKNSPMTSRDYSILSCKNIFFKHLYAHTN
jgi:ornithine cyclodeaminase/alanine dehydrogenase-like protein (mu-crystallin family)